MAITNVILLLLNLMLCMVIALAVLLLVKRLSSGFVVARQGWLALGSIVTGAALWVCQFMGRVSTDSLPVGELPVAGVFVSVAATIIFIWAYSFIQMRQTMREPMRLLVSALSAALMTTLLLSSAGFAGGWLGLLFGSVVESRNLQSANGLLLLAVLLPGCYIVARLQQRKRLHSAAGLLGSLLFVAPLLAMPDPTVLWTVIPNRQLALTTETLGFFSILSLVVTIAVAVWSDRLRSRASLLGKRLATAVRDIEVESAQRAASLTAGKERAEITLHSISDAVITTNINGVIETLNPTAEALLAVNAAVAIGRPLSEVYQIVDSQQPVSELAARRRNQITRKLRLQDGSELAVSESRSQIRGDDGLSLGEILVFGDVSQSLDKAEELARQARTDSLTGLSNRVEFERLLQDAMHRFGRGEARVAPVLLYVDLDEFKPVNDTAGHAAGDELLRQLANTMREVIGSAEHQGVVARLGGDEFGVLLENTRLPQSIALAEKLCNEIGEFCFGWKHLVIKVGASIGAVELNSAIRDPQLALIQADQACYRAKQRGRGCVELFEASDAELQLVQQESQWAQRLRRALDENRFVLHREDIAPLYGMADGSQFEVELKMLDENGQLLPPKAFLPAAQRFGLAAEIDRWVLLNTLDYLAETPEPQAQLCSVNISAATLTERGFAEWLERQLRRRRVNGSRLCIDVAECAAVGHLSDTLAFMRALKPLGCRFALDNFGSGMATFGYLKTLPLNYLKIDAAFVRDIGRDRLDRAIVAAISEIGQVLGLEVVAEGVRDAATVARLRGIGVEYIQGRVIGELTPLYPEPGTSVVPVIQPPAPLLPIRAAKQMAC